jgi:hypothetical protein
MCSPAGAPGKMVGMDLARARLLLEALTPTGHVDRVREFAGSLRRSASRRSGGLLVVGTPGYEPWHFTAHLADEARYSGVPELEPTLVRWSVPADAPGHLAVPLDRLQAARRGETLMVVTEEVAPEALLERVADARKVGATIFTMDTGDRELGDLAHDALVLPPDPGPAGAGDDDAALDALPGLAPQLAGYPLTFNVGQHVLPVAAGDQPSRARRAQGKLARFLDVIAGPPARSDW